MMPEQNGRYIVDTSFLCIFLNEFYATLISLKPVPEGPTDTCMDSVNSSARQARINRKPLPEPMMTQFIDASIRGETIRYCHDMIHISIQVSWYKLRYDTYMLFFDIFKFLNSNLRIIEYIIQKRCVSSSILLYIDTYLDDCITIHRDTWCIVWPLASIYIYVLPCLKSTC